MMNKNDDVKVIGLIIEEMQSDFSKELIQSIVNSIPKDGNFRLIVLPIKYVHTQNISANQRVYRTMYNSVYRLGELCEIDGFIIHLGSMSQRKKKVIKTGYLDRFRHIPKVFIASDMEGETTVNYDNETGIREAVECLINVNGLTKLCMLGGRDDNIDAQARKRIFIRCLNDNGVGFIEQNYESTDMSEHCVAEALRLLERNRDVQAIFCVNDSVAKGLYEAMAIKCLVPGKDILVFGFDNTRMSGEMIPSLSSVGAGSCSLGQKALELMLCKLDNKEADSCSIPTRLYGRESFSYEMYDYTTLELLQVKPAFVYRMFDDCFYRYKNESVGRESVDLRRLFFEVTTRMLKTIKNRYMSSESLSEIERMIDVFFREGAMKYTDAIKLVKCIDTLQLSINTHQKSPSLNMIMNRLFQRMKDRAICALAEEKSIERDLHYTNISNLQDFMIAVTDINGNTSLDAMLRNMDKLGLAHSVLYLFEEPVKYDVSKGTSYPENICLKCVLRDNELYILPKERQSCLLSEIFIRKELSPRCRGYAVFALYYGDQLYGIMMCELADDIYDRGEFIAGQLARTIYIERMSNNKTE